MSVLRKYRKTIEKTNLYFDPEMYNNIVGSLVLSHYVLSLLKGETVDKENIKKVWKKFGLKGFFVVPLQPQTKKTRGDDKGHGFVLSS